MKKLSVKNISKSFSNKKILKDISIDLKMGETVAILGKSGSGKTTLLNIIGGILEPEKGEIILCGQNIINKPGNISYMPQEDLLFEHLTILENIILPLRIKNTRKKDAIKTAETIFNKFLPEDSKNLYPFQISGGMRQRAAFLRNYMAAKEIVILDEPFSCLDFITKQQIHKWFLEIKKELNLSIIFITHDIDEALILSDRIYVLNKTPSEICANIKLNKVENFINSSQYQTIRNLLIEKLEI